jgi:hypothetical protein
MAYRTYATILRWLLMWRPETALNGSVAEPSVARGMVDIGQRKTRKERGRTNASSSLHRARRWRRRCGRTLPLGACHLRNKGIAKDVHGSPGSTSSGPRPVPLNTPPLQGYGSIPYPLHPAVASNTAVSDPRVHKFSKNTSLGRLMSLLLVQM